MSQNSQPVPRLDLAPKLSRPLSLWNPFDYLRLLYWVFFFPQALPWYIDTFGGKGFKEAKTGIQWWEWQRQNPIEDQLILQALTLIIVLPIILNGFLVQVGFAVHWFLVALGVLFGVVKYINSVMSSDVASGVAWGLALNVVSGTGLGVAFGVAFGGVFGALWGVGFGVAFGVAIARPEDWLFALGFTLLQPRNQNRYFSHVTPLPLPYLSSQVANWLRRDWETGKHNINQLSRFTFQSIPVVQAVNKVLAETPPELLIYRIARLPDKLYTSDLLSNFVLNFLSEIHLDTPARAAFAGFWYLTQEKPKNAIEAFAVVRDLPLGEEMFIFAQILSAFYTRMEPAQIAALNVPASPNQPFLHLTAWDAIAALRRVISDVQIVEQSASKSARSLALKRALGELKDILDGADNIPKSERNLIINIAQSWQNSLLVITG